MLCFLAQKARPPNVKFKLQACSVWIHAWHMSGCSASKFCFDEADNKLSQNVTIDESPGMNQGFERFDQNVMIDESPGVYQGIEKFVQNITEAEMNRGVERVAQNVMIPKSPGLRQWIPLSSIDEICSSLLSCRKSRCQSQALLLYDQVCGLGLESHSSLGNYVVPMLVEAGCMSTAQRFFERLESRNMFSWISLICGYVKFGNPMFALTLFEKMREHDSVLDLNGHAIVSLLKACIQLRDIETGTELHTFVYKKSVLLSDPFIGSALVDMYVKFGNIDKAQDVFNDFVVRDAILWTTLIAGFAEFSKGGEALKCAERMEMEGISPDSVSYVHLLKACGDKRAIAKGQEMHVKTASAENLEKDAFLPSALVDLYCKCGLVAKADYVFNHIHVHDVVTWTSLITGYVENEQGQEALKCFEKMQQEGVFPDAISLISMLKACASILDTEKGKQFHAKAVSAGILKADINVPNTLAHMYMKCGLMAEAEKIFQKLLLRDVVSWTVLISGYSEEGYGRQALDCFVQMQAEGFLPNPVTYVYALKACTITENIRQGQNIHTEIEKRGLFEVHLVATNLVNMYLKCGLLREAQHTFNKVSNPDVVIWTTLMRGYVDHECDDEALYCYSQMLLGGVSPSNTTFVCTLRACGNIGDVEKGKEILSEIERRGLFKGDMIIGTTVVDMYSKCGMLSKAQEVFDKLQGRDVVSWNALVTGYVEYGHDKEAMNCYEEMLIEGLNPDEVTFASILKACCSLKDADRGRKVHAYIETLGVFEKDNVISIVLVGMYAKCGLFEEAWEIFNKVKARNVDAWNAFVGSYAEHGCNNELLQCLAKMEAEGISPNAVTLLCVLKAWQNTRFVENTVPLESTVKGEGAEHDLITIAEAIFDKIPHRDATLWTALISGYIEQGLNVESLKCYNQMQLEGVSPSAITYLCVLKACGRIGAIEKCEKIHADIIKKGLFETDHVIGNALVSMYAKRGLLDVAEHLFKKLPVRDVVTWTTLITGYMEHGYEEEGITCFEQMQQHNVSPDTVTFVCILKACSSIGVISKTEEIVCEIERTGFLDKGIVDTTMLGAYSKSGNLEKAQGIFNNLLVHDIVAWTALISGYSDHGHGKEALKCFEQMKAQGNLPDAVTYTCCLKACSKLGALEKGQEIHSQVVNGEFLGQDLGVGTALIEMYSKCDALSRAEEVFDGLPIRDTLLWNTLLTAYVEHGFGERVFECLEQMQIEGLSPDILTFISSLRSFGSLQASIMGQEMHSLVEMHGLAKDALVNKSLIDMYAKCGSLDIAHHLLLNLPNRDVESWTAVISGYSEFGLGEKALCLFEQMLADNVLPDSDTYVCILKTCHETGSIVKAKEIHSEIKRLQLDKDMIVGTALIDMYAKSQLLAHAQDVFDELPVKDVVTWTSLIEGYIENEQSDVALTHFEQMQVQGISTDAVALISGLRACCVIGATEEALKLHADIERKGLMEEDIFAGNSLISIYARSGLHSEAEHIFEKLQSRDIVTWNSLMGGYVHHGQTGKVFDLYSRMLIEGFIPDEVTFLVVLNACSREGLLHQSQMYYEAMTNDYGILPCREHQHGIIDLLCRIGHLDRAIEMTMKMPFCPNDVVWHTVLGACRNSGNVHLGKHAFQTAMDLDSVDAASSVLMSQIYANA